ncbi:MAG TPA: hypothetical protein VL020_02935, partial [Pseudomonadales bacterium]|nr:hypothetical protein [Pseudomonadales bacterium]
DAETVRRERDALITKLDQNKAQKPVGIFTKSDISQYIQLRSGDATTNPIPLYAAPVDQTAEIESITSYAKQIIAAFDEDNDLDNPEKFNAYHNLKSAISGKEPE